MKKRLIIGIDMGGTNLKVGLLDSRARLISKHSIPTKNFKDKLSLIAALCGAINGIIKDNNLRKSDILGVGVGVPGPTDHESGKVHFFPNIPGWKNVPLRHILEKRLRLPVSLDNDAKVMALAEYKLGAGRGFQNILCLTLGTGVGGGLILNGRIYRGQDNVAGEIGHLSLNEQGPRCNCGGRACLESYIGNQHLLKQAQRSFGKKITLERLSGLSKKGDKKARSFWQEAGRRLGLALTAAANLLNLDACVVGGGVAEAGEVLFKSTRDTIKKRAMSVQAGRVKVLKARLGSDAGMVGAALLVRERLVLCLFAVLCFWTPLACFAQEGKEPIVVNGDQVEYSTDEKEITATGKVEVIYKGSKLTCQKLTVNTQTKDAVAEGFVVLSDAKGTIEGSKMSYNFDTKTGTIFDSNFRANPYFGKAATVKKISDEQFVAIDGSITTCNLDHPHYRFKIKEARMFPGDKIQTKDSTVYIGKAPLLYIPRFNRSLKDVESHFQVMPGKRSDWGGYLLSTYRQNLTPELNSRVYLDYRSKLGLAEGLGLNLNSEEFGKGDLKFYYTNENPEGSDDDYERYLLRLRHKWQIDPNTQLAAELYKITDERRKVRSDRNLLKDYFYREYEQDSQPLSYVSFHRNFGYSSFDLLAQKRVNHWYDQLDKLPEALYSLPSLQLGESPFYFENGSSFAVFGKKASTSPVSADDVKVARLDTFNKFSLPARLAIFRVAPFVGLRETVYDKGKDDKTLPARTVFYSGVDLSTKFYKVLNVKTNFLNMDVDGLRHIITPTVGYAYNHDPTVKSNNLYQIDSVDSLATSNAASLGLSNKLQTRRDGLSVDLADLLVTSSYVFNPKDGVRSGSYLSDILLNLKLLPYSWLRLQSDATYRRSGSRSDANYRKFVNANYDVSLGLAEGRSLGLGQRYQRKGGNELTASLSWRLNPKWSFSIYQRYGLKGYVDPSGVFVKRGTLEQQYTFSRDLHCWVMDITFSTKRQEDATVFFVFRLKAFPEMEFGFEQSYRSPQSGAQ